MAQDNQLEVVYSCSPPAILGEGPCWDAAQGRLYWVDIERFQVHVWNPSTRANDSLQLKTHVGCVVPRASGGVVCALRDGIYSLDLQHGSLVKLADPEPSAPGNRFNDGKCDPRGRLWVGSMELAEERAVGALYCLDTDLRVHKRVEGVTVSNGLAWSPDHCTLYYIDSPLHRVDAFDYDAATGTLDNRRTVLRIEEGFPDGMCVDAEGMLWVAHWGGGRVSRWDPRTGVCVREVPLPCSLVTSVCFGGPTLSELYITTASRGVDLAREPLAGSLFLLRNPGAPGLPETPFAG